MKICLSELQELRTSFDALQNTGYRHGHIGMSDPNGEEGATGLNGKRDKWVPLVWLIISICPGSTITIPFVCSLPYAETSCKIIWCYSYSHYFLCKLIFSHFQRS